MDLVGDGHHNVGLETSLNLAVGDHGNRSVGDLGLATMETAC